MDDHDNDDANTRENILTAAAENEIYEGCDTKIFLESHHPMNLK